MPEILSLPPPHAEPAAKGVFPKRLAVVITHPIQHFVPLFARLAQMPDVELKVFFCCD